MEGVDLVLSIPGDHSQHQGSYRLDYRPPVGVPVVNTTFTSSELSKAINISSCLPGTKYDFWMYFSNTSITDWLTWTASITTAPGPPTQLGLDIQSGEKAEVRWQPPSTGGFSRFRLKVAPLSESTAPMRNLVVAKTEASLQNLTAGATYEVQLYTMLDDKESQTYISTNFTTKPRTPGDFIVWYYNETTLLVLWQPPEPEGYFTDYKVCIDPADAHVSETYVPNEVPSGPSQAAFNGLVPGRPYNVSVQTLSEGQLSDPVTAQYRTLPLRARNVRVDQETIGTDSFTVWWDGPDPTKISEFEKYQVELSSRNESAQFIEKGAPRAVNFTDKLDPGQTYQVLVKTVSGSVSSWPADVNVTIPPYPVMELTVEEDEEAEEIVLTWRPDQRSTQDSYKVLYEEVLYEDVLYEEVLNVRSEESFTSIPEFRIPRCTDCTDPCLRPQKFFTFMVFAVSTQVQSEESRINHKLSNIRSQCNEIIGPDENSEDDDHDNEENDNEENEIWAIILEISR